MKIKKIRTTPSIFQYKGITITMHAMTTYRISNRTVALICDQGQEAWDMSTHSSKMQRCLPILNKQRKQQTTNKTTYQINR